MPAGTAAAVVTAVLVVAGVVVAVLDAATGPDDAAVVELLVPLSLAVGYGVVGWVVERGTGGHSVGRLFLAVGLLGAVGFLGQGLAVLGYVDGRTVPGVAGIARVQDSVTAGAVALLAAAALLFPDGRTTSRTGRVLVAAALLSAALLVVGAPLVDVEVTAGGHVLPVATAVDPGGLDGVLWLASSLLLWPAFVGAIVTLVRRFRAASGVARQQLLWPAFAATVTAALLAASIAPWPYVDDLHVAAGFVVTLGLPAAAGVAITRHRLYDLGRLVSRTVVYAVVTSVLGAVYAALVLGVGSRLGPDDAPDVLVAGSTLVVAGLFRPVRGGVQRWVDRHFARRRWDAEQVVAAFARRLRDEVALSVLTEDLHRTVTGVLQPAGATLWLRPDPDQAGTTGDSRPVATS